MYRKTAHDIRVAMAPEKHVGPPARSASTAKRVVNRSRAAAASSSSSITESDRESSSPVRPTRKRRSTTSGLAKRTDVTLVEASADDSSEDEAVEEAESKPAAVSVKRTRGGARKSGSVSDAMEVDSTETHTPVKPVVTLASLQSPENNEFQQSRSSGPKPITSPFVRTLEVVDLSAAPMTDFGTAHVRESSTSDDFPTMPPARLVTPPSKSPARVAQPLSYEEMTKRGKENAALLAREIASRVVGTESAAAAPSTPAREAASPAAPVTPHDVASTGTDAWYLKSPLLRSFFSIPTPQKSAARVKHVDRSSFWLGIGSTIALLVAFVVMWSFVPYCDSTSAIAAAAAGSHAHGSDVVPRTGDFLAAAMVPKGLCRVCPDGATCTGGSAECPDYHALNFFGSRCEQVVDIETKRAMINMAIHTVLADEAGRYECGVNGSAKALDTKTLRSLVRSQIGKSASFDKSFESELEEISLDTSDSDIVSHNGKYWSLVANKPFTCRVREAIYRNIIYIIVFFAFALFVTRSILRFKRTFSKFFCVCTD